MIKSINQPIIKSLRTRQKEKLFELLGYRNSNNSIQLNEESAHTSNDLSESNDLDNSPSELSDDTDSIHELEAKIQNKNSTQSDQLLTLLIPDHFVAFQQYIDLYTLLYTSIIFRWFKSDKVRIKLTIFNK